MIRRLNFTWIACFWLLGACATVPPVPTDSDLKNDGSLTQTEALYRRYSVNPAGPTYVVGQPSAWVPPMSRVPLIDPKLRGYVASSDKAEKKFVMPVWAVLSTAGMGVTVVMAGAFVGWVSSLLIARALVGTPGLETSGVRSTVTNPTVLVVWAIGGGLLAVGAVVLLMTSSFMMAFVVNGDKRAVEEFNSDLRERIRKNGPATKQEK